MSRIGKNPVNVPAGVEITLKGQELVAKGKLGQKSIVIHDEIAVDLKDGLVTLAKKSNSKTAKIMWGTARTLVSNLITGVSDGFEKRLEINGVGYRAAVQGKDLVLQLGFSHEVKHPIPEGIQITAEKPTLLSIKGSDCQLVGAVAAKIRSYRKPEPYKGKGVNYEGAYILRKEGKKK